MVTLLRPTGLHDWLFGIAQDLAETEEQKSKHLVERIAEIKARHAELEKELFNSQGARERALRFEPVLLGAYQCPICWTTDETQTDLAPISSDSDEDLFRCKRCHNEFSKEG